MQLFVFCEAPADFRIASELVDRMLRESGPAWLGDLLEVAPEAVRSWHGDSDERTFFDIHKLDAYARRLSVRVPHGHFDGRPGRAGAAMARTVFAILRKLVQNGTVVDAVLVMWDMDDRPAERRMGLEQARSEATKWAVFRIVFGCPNAMREAWVLGGFDPEGDQEEQCMKELRRELGFSPNEEAHRLDASDEQARRSAKRVLRQLTGGDHQREARCWNQTPLATLRKRGGETGLRAYLDEITQHLVPLATSVRDGR